MQNRSFTRLLANLFTLLAFVVVFASCDADTHEAVDVPPAVLSAFQAAYPGATDVEWEMDGDNVYEVEFNYKGEDMEIEYGPTGKVLEIEH